MRDSIKALFHYAWTAASIPDRLISGLLLGMTVFNLATAQLVDGFLLLVILYLNVQCLAWSGLATRQGGVIEAQKQIIDELGTDRSQNVEYHIYESDLKDVPPFREQVAKLSPRAQNFMR